MQRPLQIPPAEGASPPGFRIRPLSGDDEVEAYVELHQSVFESKNMTVEWRARTLSRPEYRAGLDLVAVAPGGRLAAFCVCWLDRDAEEEPVGQIEPLGVHPDFRQVGLGRAILSEALRRLYSCGASKAYVETDKHRGAALELYQAAGFQPVQDVLVYRRDYAT
jgi:mycothiol synthase